MEPLPSISTEPELARVTEARTTKSLLREYGEALAIALVLAFLIRSFGVQAFKIPSGSMLPTLEVGDHILVNKLAYGIHVPFVDAAFFTFGAPRRGEVVVFVYPLDAEKDYIKRVVGVPGDIVLIRNKHVYINGTLWNDPAAYFADGEGVGQGNQPRDNYGPTEVPDGHLFVMGDNRDHSYDSRFWGFVDLKNVKGKAFLVYWSWGNKERWVRWERLGRIIR
ncbi:MAG: signal peptidase I [Deltaproteobacteria bacterium]|nr:signal peptidase I [Deltaproteobacteria bacterium]